MMQVEELIKRAGGLRKLEQIGLQCNNRYFVKADKHIKEKFAWIKFLKLDTSTPLDILDFGTGAGFFPFMCRELGHNCLGTDERGRDNYEPCYDHLKLDISPVLVPTLETLAGKFDKKFDLIVSFRSFVGTRPAVWGVEEWKYFLKDCSDNLLKNDNSRIFFSCNSGLKTSPYSSMPASEVSVWGPKELGDFFAPFFVERNKKSGLKGNIFSITKKQIDQLK